MERGGGGPGGRVREQLGVGVDRGPVRAVHPAALAGEHVVVDRVPGEGVPEPVAAARDEEQMRVDRLAQRRQRVRGGVAGCREQQRLVHRRAAHRRVLHEPLRIVAERIDAGEQEVAQRGREPGRIAAVPDDPDQLLDEEGVAIGSGEDGLHHALPRGDAEDRRGELADLVEVEAAELQVPDGPHPLPADHEGTERMPPVQLVGPVRHEERDRHAAECLDEVRGEVEGGAVGPVQVLEDDEQRLIGSEALEQAQHRLEQLRALLRRALDGLAEGGHQSRQQPAGRSEDRGERLGRGGAGEIAERLDERRERQALRTELHAVPRQHPHPGRRRESCRLVHEPGLPDSRLARQEHQAGLGGAGGGEQRRELRPLARPSHHDRRDRCTRRVHPALLTIVVILPPGVRLGVRRMRKDPAARHPLADGLQPVPAKEGRIRGGRGRGRGAGRTS